MGRKILQRRGPIQLAEIEDGLVVRHRDGLSVLRGVRRQDVEAVLALVDAGRDAAAIRDELGPRAVALLGQLEGDVLERRPGPLPGRVHAVANGPGGERLAERLADEGLDVDVDEGVDEAALAVVLLEDVSYGTLFDLQRGALDAAVPALFLTADADGVRVGPSVLPGVSPCFACAQRASFASLPVDPARLRTLRWDEAGNPAALDAAAREARRLLDPEDEPALSARVVLFRPGGETRYPVVPDPACALCRGAGRNALPTAVEIVEAHERRPPRAAAEDGDVARSVVVLGGGTAGYLTALALRKKLPHLDVTLIESSAVPIVGVGEATTPLLPQFLHADLGFPIAELFEEVRPTLKLGIRFLWGGANGGGAFNYPFGPLHLLEALVHGGDLGQASLRSMLMTAGRVPLYADGERWIPRLDTETAYHLDNRRFVAYLRRKAAEVGVLPVDATIADAVLDEDGEEVRVLVAEDGRRFEADLFADCSGFRAFLIEKVLGSPFVSFSSSLFTDRALVARVPHGGVVLPYTTAEAMSAGWRWSTPQADADHRGYVYSSAFLSDGEAEAEMRAGMENARVVRFRPGRHEHFWRGNVVALGNAYGFVEPLESTALHMLVKEIGELVRSFPLRRGERSAAALLNRRVGAEWDYLRWFLALHFKFNRRLTTPFWRACRDEIDVTAFGELLERFRERGPLSYDPAARRVFDYPDPLWGPQGIDAVLLGQDVRARLPRPRTSAEAWARRIELCRGVVERALPQERALAAFVAEPRLLARLEKAFREHGPAFGYT